MEILAGKGRKVCATVTEPERRGQSVAYAGMTWFATVIAAMQNLGVFRSGGAVLRAGRASG